MSITNNLTFNDTAEIAVLRKNYANVQKGAKILGITTIALFVIGALAFYTVDSLSQGALETGSSLKTFYTVGIAISAVFVLSLAYAYYKKRKIQKLQQSREMNVDQMIALLNSNASSEYKAHYLQDLSPSSLITLIERLAREENHNIITLGYLKAHKLNNPLLWQAINTLAPDANNPTRHFQLNEFFSKVDASTLIEQTTPIIEYSSQKVIASTLYWDQWVQAKRTFIHRDSLFIVLTVTAITLFALSFLWNSNFSRNITELSLENLALNASILVMATALVNKVLSVFAKQKLHKINNLRRTTFREIVEYYRNSDPSHHLILNMKPLELRSFLHYADSLRLDRAVQNRISESVQIYAKQKPCGPLKWQGVVAEGHSALARWLS